MNDQITSAAQLGALPAGTVIKVHDDPTAPNSFWLKGSGGLWWTFAAGHGYTSDEMAESGWGFVVLYRPDEPQRVQPSREAIRDELSGWPIGSGYYATAVGTGEAAEIADAVLALWPGRTEAEVKAEALREAAQVFHDRLPDGTGNGRAYNSHRVAAMLRERADRLEAEARHG